MPAFAQLDRDLKTDVLIIGGGLCGLLCARRLTDAGIRCALIEAGRICSGVSARTTAKITSQHGPIYHRLLRSMGPERARMYYEANEAALDRYRAMCSGIDCCFETRDAYVYETDGVEALEKEAAALERIGAAFDRVDHVDCLPFSVRGAIRFRNQAQFHPLRFAGAIAGGLTIFEHTAARAYDGRDVVTDGGRITAKKLLVATHFPLFNKHGAYFLKLYQHRSYVLALAGAPDVHGMFIDARETGLSLRNAGNLLLLGGGSHRTGKQGGGWAELTAFAHAHFPGAREVCRWATQDCMTLDGVPCIGRYAAGTPSLYVATGFNKWGMTASMIAADLLCDLLQDRKNDYAPLFSPQRSILHPQLLCNALETAAGLLTPTVPRCPHMGCALKWNPQERSWDCACHGSRFSEDGALLNTPATGGLRRPGKAR